MEELIRKLTGLFQASFAGCELELEAVSVDRVSGFIIWEGFSEREQIDRQREVWHVVRSHLDPREQQQISALLTLTPEEMAAARHG